jgi:hypothetical protein
MVSEMNSSRPWGDWMLEEDEERSHRIVRMTDAEWKECMKNTVTNNRGKGDLRVVLNWFDAMDALRAEHKAKTAGPLIVRDMSPQAVSFRLWKDMVEEPAKYGDADWADWLVLNEELRAGPGRWRLEAFWLAREAEEEPRIRAYAATRIQAAWRGHSARDTLPGLSCENCLARTFAPQQWNGQHVCLDCMEYQFEHFANFIQPPVPLIPKVPSPRAEPDENGCVPCDGCGRVVCDVGDYGEYRPGWWCSRRCAYD